MRRANWYAGASLTFGWLLVLFITTRFQRALTRREARRVQVANSTNLRRLDQEPTRVLSTSLFWLDDRTWWPYVPLFVLVVAPAERRLGWWRWLGIGLVAHVVATYAGQSYLRWSIKRGRAPRRLVNARDVGVSYFVLGVAGTLSGYLRPPGRVGWQIIGGAALAANAALRPTFTELGHLTAYLVGVAAVPWAPNRDQFGYPSRRV